MRLDRLSIIYPYYENPSMLSIQLAHWQSYPAELKEKCRFIVVDDGSPRNPAKDIIGSKPGLNLNLYRVQENIPWNQHGARNLGASQTKDKWLFVGDMDLVLDAENCQKIFNEDLSDTSIYRFSRVKMPDWEPYKHHCNTWLIRKDQYWEFGGYDEDYCGTYGGDGPFARALEAKYNPVIFPKICLKYYGRSYIKDSGTNDFDRDGALRQKYHDIGRRKKDTGDTKARNPIRFPWEQIL